MRKRIYNMELMTNKCQEIVICETFPSFRMFRKRMFVIKNSPRGRTSILRGLYEFMKILRDRPNYISLAHAMRPVFRNLVEYELMIKPFQTIKWLRECEDDRYYEGLKNEKGFNKTLFIIGIHEVAMNSMLSHHKTKNRCN